MTQILTQLDQRSISWIRSLWGWIACVKRPLAKHELLSALSFQCEAPYFDGLAPGYILQICSSLIEQRSNNTFCFIHVSLQEYVILAVDNFNLFLKTDTVHRFLQSPSSLLKIEAVGALSEHTKAVIGCLLYGIRHFCGADEHDKSLRVIKGEHGLHIYAFEYWADLLMEYCKRRSPDAYESNLIRAACDLASELDAAMVTSPEGKDLETYIAENPKLRLPKEWPHLQRHVARELVKRSSLHVAELSTGSMDSNGGQPAHRNLDGIETTLATYQTMIRSLLTQQWFTGVSAERFEAFKAQYRTAAFTCRFPRCPFASRGFESMEECQQHEEPHTIKLSCEVPGCEYHRFSSQIGLKRHMATRHPVLPPRRRIRRVQRVASLHHPAMEQAARVHSQTGPVQAPDPASRKDTLRVETVELHTLENTNVLFQDQRIDKTSIFGSPRHFLASGGSIDTSPTSMTSIEDLNYAYDVGEEGVSPGISSADLMDLDIQPLEA